MPRYFFDLRGGEIEADDDDGLVLPNDNVAHERAVTFARDILAAAVLEGRLALRERIVVRDESGRMVESLPLGQSVGLPE